MGLTRGQRVYRVFISDLSSLWFCLAGLLAAWLLPIPFSHTAETHARYTGLALEVGGIGTVAYGLFEMRQLFNRPSFRKSFKAWWERLKWVFRPPPPTVLEPKGSVSGTSMGSARVTIGWNDEWSLEKKVEWLKERHDDLSSDLKKRISDLRETDRNLGKRISEERRERSDEASDIKKKLEGLAVGGLNLEAIGLVWILVGLISATLSVELANTILFGD